MLVTFEAKKSTDGKKPTRGHAIASSLKSNRESSTSTVFTDDAQDVPVIHDLASQNPPDSKVFNYTKKKSKGGCITCKIRKKRCTEERPVCGDCNRLGKNCVWATKEMSVEHVRELKRKVEEEERNSKERRQSRLPSKKQRTADRFVIDEKADMRKESDNDSNENGSKNSFKKQETEITDNHDDNTPLDTELNYNKQTPVSANLLHFPTRSQLSPSPQLAPFSPKWDPLPDQFLEFSNFLESNMRSNSDKFSNRITQLEDDDDQNHDHQNKSQDLITRGSPVSIESILADSPLFAFNSLNNIPLPNPSSHDLNLDSVGMKLYDYYIHKLSKIISIVPAESNYYTKVFLPMATVNPGILYSIIAWSGYHMGGSFEKEGAKYMDRALDYINDTPLKTDSDALQRLANLLIMCGAEICRGDVKKWPIFLQWGAKLIRDRGGLYKFNQDKEQHWLISSFAYHDILASSTSERGTYFSVEDYDNFIVNFGFGVDPLQGIVKPLFNIIGEISTLATEAKKLLKISSNSLGYGIMNDEDEMTGDDVKDGDSHEIPGTDDDSQDSHPSRTGVKKKVTRYASLLTIMQKASNLENKINQVKPDPQDLNQFSSEELELQLTLFESFQLTAKLHLRQSVLRLNPSSLETQFILCELLKCLDIVLKSSVESSLCFPLFIAGMNCTTKKDRKMMLVRFQDIIQRYSFQNLDRAKTIMEQVWLIDPSGTRCVDWYEIVKRLGWDLSFA